MLEVIVSVLSAVTSVLTAILIRTVNQRDRKAEERQRQLIECRTAEMQYTRSIGNLAGCTAKAVQRAGIANGDVEDAARYYRVKERELEEFYQKLSVVNNVKGV